MLFRSLEIGQDIRQHKAPFDGAFAALQAIDMVRAADDGKVAVRLQLAFLVKHADHSAHTIIRRDYLLKDPSFV